MYDPSTRVDNETCGKISPTNKDLNITKSGSYPIKIILDPLNKTKRKNSFEDVLKVRINLPEELRCQDSDNGVNINEKGVIKGIFPSTNRSCQETQEFYGKENVKCYKSESLNNFKEDLEINRDTIIEIYDSCYTDIANKQYVREWNCENGFIREQTVIACPNSCSDGVCN